MRVTSKGQVTIPRDLRETFGIDANSEVHFRHRRREDHALVEA